MLKESDLDLLTRELSGVKQKWESIVDELHPYGFPSFSSVADDIRRQYSDAGYRLREMIKKQLQNNLTTITWRNIMDALRSPRVRESQLADQLEAKYCPSEFINNNILLYFSEYSVVQHCTRSTPHKV